MDLVLLGAAGGATAGFAGRSLLAHLRRGTVVHSGWLAGAVALLWAAVASRVASGHVPAWWLPVPLALTWFATLLTVVDLRHRRLPDALTLPAYPAMAAATALSAILGDDWSIALRAASGALLFGTLHAAVHVVRPRSLGAGDVKLSGSVGAALAASGWPALVLAAVLAALVTLLLGALTRPPRGDGIPHGPGLLAATCLFTTFPTAAVTTP
ncbi:prepilin peptidase [Actinophytocola sp.]|uniref:prepilin peptidase n=1 Tax=Actinophytocola sp. TaxID=1872138 RepID=UPI003D6B6769